MVLVVLLRSTKAEVTWPEWRQDAWLTSAGNSEPGMPSVGTTFELITKVTHLAKIVVCLKCIVEQPHCTDLMPNL